MELLREGAKSLGLILGSVHLSAFEQYYRELASWNQRFNLTTITGYEEVQSRHFLDSLSCVLALPAGDGEEKVPDEVPLQRSLHPLWCVDVGSGAGFPGLPLKIMLPEAKMTLVEATGKKVVFLRHIVRVLQLENVEVIHARAEDVGHMPEHRERYDLVVARAVASLCVLAEYCLPLCRVGGSVVVQKGEDAEEEAGTAEPAFRTLGGTLRDIKPVVLPGLPAGRCLVVVSKVGKVPDAYPRRPGVPSKRPLR